MTHSQQIPPNNKGFMRLPEILKRFPVSKSTWWAGIKDGRFPKPVKLSARITAWRSEEIEALIARRNKIV